MAALRPFGVRRQRGAESDGEAKDLTAQTFLDLKRLAGRGEEAAAAVFEKHLASQLQEAARRVKELRDDEL